MLPRIDLQAFKQHTVKIILMSTQLYLTGQEEGKWYFKVQRELRQAERNYLHSIHSLVEWLPIKIIAAVLFYCYTAMIFSFKYITHT